LSHAVRDDATQWSWSLSRTVMPAISLNFDRDLLNFDRFSRAPNRYAQDWAGELSAAAQAMRIGGRSSQHATGNGTGRYVASCIDFDHSLLVR
jgi:hypothetical protein